MRKSDSYMRTSETTQSGISWEIAPNDRVSGILKLSGNLKPGWLGQLSSYMSQERETAKAKETRAAQNQTRKSKMATCKELTGQRWVKIDKTQKPRNRTRKNNRIPPCQTGLDRTMVK